jgi:Tol biopolymer transport system component
MRTTSVLIAAVVAVTVICVDKPLAAGYDPTAVSSPAISSPAAEPGTEGASSGAPAGSLIYSSCSGDEETRECGAVYWTDDRAGAVHHPLEIDGSGPAWSKTAGRIAFVGPHPRYPTRGGEVFSVDRSGEDRRRLTNDRVNELYPRWSPAGRRMLWLRFPGPSLVTKNLRSGAVKRLTDGWRLQGADWCSDGSIVAAMEDSSRGLGLDLYRIDPSTGSRKRLVGAELVDEYQPRCSPDSRRVAFVRRKLIVGDCEGCGTAGLWVIRASGRGLRRLYQDKPVGRDVDDLAWAPGGRRIFYTRATAKGNQIFVVALDGSGRKRLSDVPYSIEDIDHVD